MSHFKIFPRWSDWARTAAESSIIANSKVAFLILIPSLGAAIVALSRSVSGILRIRTEGGNLGCLNITDGRNFTASAEAVKAKSIWRALLKE
jgi:hypothetical protein